MVVRWRGFAVLFWVLVSLLGCSGESTSGDDAGRPSSSGGSTSGGKAGQGGTGVGVGGKGGAGGRGGAGRGGMSGSGASTGATGGSVISEGGAAGVVQKGGHGGSGGSSGVGGASGRAGSGGALGGAGGRAGGGMSGVMVAGRAGSGGGVPLNWDCSVQAYGDGVCDCGCNAVDVDCKTHDLNACERCNAQGSCGLAQCPGRIDPMNPAGCLAPPAGWSCDWRQYEDGTTCDCGCGIHDPDCADDTSASCDQCGQRGSCAGGSCPSSINPTDNTQCAVPKAWLCSAYNYGDGSCDCGCGVVDIDCKSANADACDGCPWNSCSPYGCLNGNGTIMPNDNALCTAPPPAWTCPARLYNDGSGCDCGCGFPDPDCGALELAQCVRCDDPGSCSSAACPGLVDPDNIAVCTHPDPPPEWTCDPFFYSQDGVCNCGCGAPDPDCRGSTTDVCQGCPACGSSVCPSYIDPTDITKCKPAPSGWTCNASRYGDGACDCGCGVMDIDCQTNGAVYCYSCPEEGCTGGDCKRLTSGDVTTCKFDIPSAWKCTRLFYGDGICDCGCGVIDRDCASSNASACVACNDPGSCSTAKCPGTISATDNTSCSTN